MTSPWEQTVLSHRVRDNESLADVLAAPLALRPDKPALVYEDAAYTYRQLDEIANRIANGLIAAGVRPGDRVALHIDNRPDFIFNPSNDAWFGRWGPPQHLAQARLRAAEEGLPVVRATPTGISAVIDAHGRILASLPWQTAGVIDAALPPPAPSPTLFARFGNLLPLLLGFGLLLAGIVLGRTRR